MEFKFNEKRTVAVFTVKQIIRLNQPILFVCHDVEDGAWQFLTGNGQEESDAMIVSLEEILEHDPTLNELFDLPEGWQATRNSVTESWKREPMNYIDDI